MTIQNENKVFPHIVPPLPERSGSLPQDVDQLYNWIFDQQKALDELNRQVVDKYNLHLDGTHSHPAAWPYMRVRRPRYYNSTDAGTTVTVPAGASDPIYFVINGELFETTADLTCDLSGTGAGGLDTGSISASTDYYLYAINDDGAAALMASGTDPASGGPSGYDVWNYIGAVSSNGSSQFYEFSACDGLFKYNRAIETQSHTGDTNYSTETFTTLPLTARIAIGSIGHSGTANVLAVVSGTNTASTNALAQATAVLNIINYNMGMVPVFTDQTLYLQTNNSGNTVYFDLFGWVEDPTEWQ